MAFHPDVVRSLPKFVDFIVKHEESSLADIRKEIPTLDDSPNSVAKRAFYQERSANWLMSQVYYKTSYTLSCAKRISAYYAMRKTSIFLELCSSYVEGYNISKELEMHHGGNFLVPIYGTFSPLYYDFYLQDPVPIQEVDPNISTKITALVDFDISAGCCSGSSMWFAWLFLKTIDDFDGDVKACSIAVAKQFSYGAGYAPALLQTIENVETFSRGNFLKVMKTLESPKARLFGTEERFLKELNQVLNEITPGIYFINIPRHRMTVIKVSSNVYYLFDPGTGLIFFPKNFAKGLFHHIQKYYKVQLVEIPPENENIDFSKKIRQLDKRLNEDQKALRNIQNDIRRLEQKLVKLNKELEEIKQEIDDFSSSEESGDSEDEMNDSVRIYTQLIEVETKKLNALRKIERETSESIHLEIEQLQLIQEAESLTKQIKAVPAVSFSEISYPKITEIQNS